MTLGGTLASPSVQAQTAAQPLIKQVECDVLVIGGGLAGVAAADEVLRQGQTVCLTEVTDWLGGQISAQGTSALDERPRQRELLFFPQGYNYLRSRLIELSNNSRPGDCWVSLVCFLPAQGHQVVMELLEKRQRRHRGTLKLFLNTVAKDLTLDVDRRDPTGGGTIITSVLGIQHQPAVNAPPLNTYPLSQTLADAYSLQDSDLFTKTLIEFVPPQQGEQRGEWIVIEATETGEILALADLPYRLGIDPLSASNPSASSATPYPYCPQAFTYTFAMAATTTAQTQEMPPFYPQYEPFYSFDLPRYGQEPELVFTYRRIYSAKPGQDFRSVTPGDISMQNWGGGNDYGPGTPKDNVLLTRSQLQQQGQRDPGGWQGGYRIESLRGGEELALGYFYWLVAGITDSKLGPGIKQPNPYLQYLHGLDSPMGTVHGLSKFPYIREGRRLIGRYSPAWPQGFDIDEIDISRKNYPQDGYYRQQLPPAMYRELAAQMGGLGGIDLLLGNRSLDQIHWRSRSRLYPDSIGIGHYPIDFHPCMLESPPERPGNIERPGERQGAAETYPFQIPLRSLIPPQVNNLIVTGKNIAMSHIAAAAYRVQSIEWSVGAGAGTTAAYVLQHQLRPFELTDPLPLYSPHLAHLQKRLQENENPIAFPGMSIFNENWQNWP